jgi:hypothetical protein
MDILKSVEIVLQGSGCRNVVMVIGGLLTSQITHYRASGKTTKKTVRGCYDVGIYFNRNVISGSPQRTC